MVEFGGAVEEWIEVAMAMLVIGEGLGVEMMGLLNCSLQRVVGGVR